MQGMYVSGTLQVERRLDNKKWMSGTMKKFHTNTLQMFYILCCLLLSNATAVHTIQLVLQAV